MFGFGCGFLDAHASLYLLVSARPSARPPVSLKIVNATSTSHTPPQYGPSKARNSNEVYRGLTKQLYNCSKQSACHMQASTNRICAWERRCVLQNVPGPSVKFGLSQEHL